jgi:hypothetical protein
MNRNIEHKVTCVHTGKHVATLSSKGWEGGMYLCDANHNIANLDESAALDIVQAIMQAFELTEARIIQETRLETRLVPVQKTRLAVKP